jgi:glycosyltransferase 2 family protein
MNRKTLLRVVGILVAVVSLVSIAYQLWQMWPRLRQVQLAIGPAALALLCIGGSLVLAAAMWRDILSRLGVIFALSRAIHIWFVSQVVRYAPGNVWHLLGRGYLGQREGIGAHPLSLSMLLEMLHTISGGLVIGTVSLVFWPEQNIFSLWSLLLLPLLLCYCWPSLLYAPLTWLLRRMKQQPSVTRIRRRDLFQALAGYSLIWALQGGGIYLLAVAVYPVPLALSPAVIGSFAIAWVVGFLSFITPSGLGVREGVLSYLFSFLMPVPVALLLSLLARVWVTLAELGCVAVVVGVERWRNKRTIQKLT